jgi:hypothetical protein
MWDNLLEKRIQIDKEGQVPKWEKMTTYLRNPTYRKGK